MDKVNKNLTDIERKLGKTIKIVEKGPGMKLGDAVKLGTKSNSISSTIKKGIKEYDGLTPTEAESIETLEKMKKIVALTETQLGLLVENKETFEKLHVGGLVRKNMAKNREAATELSKTMLEKSPPSVKPEAQELEARNNKAFATATAAFENSKGGEETALGDEDSD